MGRISDATNIVSLDNADTFPVDRPSTAEANSATIADLKSAFGSVIPLHYSALKILHDGSQLVPEQKYLIDDYATAHILNGDGGQFDGGTHVGVLEPLVVKARTVNSLYPEAYSDKHPRDILRYQIGLDGLYTAQYDIPEFKGRIMYREDPINDIIGYHDWRYCGVRLGPVGEYLGQTVYHSAGSPDHYNPALSIVLPSINNAGASNIRFSANDKHTIPEIVLRSLATKVYIDGHQDEITFNSSVYNTIVGPCSAINAYSLWDNVYVYGSSTGIITKAAATNVTFQAGAHGTFEGELTRVQVFSGSAAGSTVPLTNALIEYPTLSEPVNIAYEDLKTIVNLNALLPGQRYRITDFRSMWFEYHIHDFKASTTTEPLIVTAKSGNKFFLEAYSEAHPKDIIRYQFEEHELLRDPWYGYDDTIEWRGMITFRHDTQKDIYMYQDWRNITFRLWELHTGQGDYYSITNNGNGYIDTVSFPAGGINDPLDLKYMSIHVDSVVGRLSPLIFVIKNTAKKVDVVSNMSYVVIDSADDLNIESSGTVYGPASVQHVKIDGGSMILSGTFSNCTFGPSAQCTLTGTFSECVFYSVDQLTMSGTYNKLFVAPAPIITDTVNGAQYQLKVTNGVLGVQLI